MFEKLKSVYKTKSDNSSLIDGNYINDINEFGVRLKWIEEEQKKEELKYYFYTDILFGSIKETTPKTINKITNEITDSYTTKTSLITLGIGANIDVTRNLSLDMGIKGYYLSCPLYLFMFCAVGQLFSGPPYYNYYFGIKLSLR
jgi:hypothetical protein